MKKLLVLVPLVLAACVPPPETHEFTRIHAHCVSGDTGRTLYDGLICDYAPLGTTGWSVSVPTRAELPCIIFGTGRYNGHGSKRLAWSHAACDFEEGPRFCYVQKYARRELFGMADYSTPSTIEPVPCPNIDSDLAEAEAEEGERIVVDKPDGFWYNRTMATALKLIEMTLPDGTAVGAPTYLSASQVLSGLAHHGGGVVHFTARFVDGKTYSGDATVEPHHVNGYDLGAHIRYQAEMYTGSAKPSHLSKKDYLAAIAKVPPEQRAFLKSLLEKYDLSGAPVKAEEKPAAEPASAKAISATLKEMRAGRFDGIAVRPEAERTEPYGDTAEERIGLLDDGFFPPGEPKDIEHYIASEPAKGFNLPTPEGKN